MICLSIKESGLAKVQEALSKSNLAEIRLDHTNLTRIETVLLFRNKRDLIATCRLYDLPEEECRRRLLWAIMASRIKKSKGKRYLDIEFDAPSSYREELVSMAKKRGFSIIISYHNYSGTDSFERLSEIVNLSADMGADIVKVVTTPKSIQEATRVLKLYKESGNVKLVAFCMGPPASFTRILSLYLGAPFGYASLDKGKESADGQYTIHEMERFLNPKSYSHKVNKRVLASNIVAPASKSHVQRAILASAWARGKTKLYAYTPCADSEAAIELVRTLGVKVKVDKCKHLKYKVEITSPGIEDISKGLTKVDLFTRSVKNVELPVGESGLLSRLILPSAGHLTGKSKGVDKVIITGKGSLNRRVLFSPGDPLAELGLNIESNEGKLPLTVSGSIHEGNITLLSSGGSQLLSGMLMSLPLCEKNSTIEVREPTSTPYVDLTIQTIKDFGITITNNDFREYKIPGRQRYKPKSFYALEGDWSGASMLLVGGAITSGVTITNLPVNSKQADEKITEVMRGCGVEITITEYPKYLVMCGDIPCAFKEESNNEVILGSKIEVAKPKNPLMPFEFDATNAPDLFPALVVLALNCNGVSKIKGISRLSNKESNRAESLYSEFTKLGADIDLEGDWMIIRGGELHGGLCLSHNDHRVAMAVITAALNIKEKVYIDDISCISKSFPDFIKYFD
ncbi:MAG: type I 3-dehydroquinate dehydratase [Bacteroidales bacterium]|nr:type I 3-dehydroquinate dehydratase [Bacteroidales bacterium]MDD4639582.1 type I 3-dehydroquinate dehydratase [Bacteroidales bacterium]